MTRSTSGSAAPATGTTNVGVIGVGAMGSGMVQSLLRHQHAVRVHDVDPKRCAWAAQAGAQVMASSAEVARRCEWVFVVVVNAQQIDAVLDHALPAPGCTWVLCSTIAPSSTHALAERIAAQDSNRAVIDAPISGGPERAALGQMSMMLAGDAARIAQGMPLFKQLSAQQFVMGSTLGDAAKAKLVNNLVAAINLAGAAEGLALAEQLGLDAATMLALMNASSAQSWIMQDRLSRALKQDYAPRAASHVLTKDVSLVHDVAAQLGVSLRLGREALTALQDTCEQGFRDEDDAALFKLMRQRLGRHG
jgi:L-threonate 2-dehydrogenase